MEVVSDIYELAKMCLSEIGVPMDGVEAAGGTGDVWAHIRWEVDSPHTAAFTKASLLTLMKTQGPDLLVRCNIHANDPDGWDKCGTVTLAEACLNAPCHRAQP